MRESIANDLLGVLRYIVVQTLLRTVDGKRQAVREYIIFDDELRERLRDMPFTHWGVISTPLPNWKSVELLTRRGSSS